MGTSEQTARETSAPGEQLKLPGALEHFEALGIQELPSGAERLTRRQLRFCVEWLRTGNATDAARLAGYSDPASDGSKVKNSPEVARFLAAAMLPIAKDVDRLIARAAERSQALHALWQAELNKDAGLRSEARLLKLEAAVNNADKLLGTLLGKITGLMVDAKVEHKHSGTINHTHDGATIVPVPAAALPALAQMRRDTVVARAGGPN